MMLKAASSLHLPASCKIFHSFDLECGEVIGQNFCNSMIAGRMFIKLQKKAACMKQAASGGLWRARTVDPYSVKVVL
jgi:hypothetical protein